MISAKKINLIFTMDFAIFTPFYAQKILQQKFVVIQVGHLIFAFSAFSQYLIPCSIFLVQAIRIVIILPNTSGKK